MAYPKADGDVLYAAEINETPPIGSIMAWLKTFANTPALPANWVECDGTVLSDADSVFNGQTLPDLNGDNAFLRGAATSWATGAKDGGEETHALSIAELAAHTHTFPIHAFDGGGSTAAQSNLAKTGDVTTTSTGSGTAHENRPPFYNIVWIIKIK